MKTSMMPDKVYQDSLRISSEQELRAFQVMLPQLLQSHKGLFVAVSNGKILDADRDEIALAERVTRKFVDRFVLIQEVREDIKPCVEQAK